PACPRGWTAHENRCFLFVKDELTWDEAEINCWEMDGTLASVHSIEEHNIIQNLILSHSDTKNSSWIGGSHYKTEGNWMWSDGTQFNFSYWCSRETDNERDQYCIQMTNSGKSQHVYQCSVDAIFTVTFIVHFLYIKMVCMFIETNKLRK
ncbi:hypothetical protein LDENG_00062890, partial [Lucifuga dentata]